MNSFQLDLKVNGESKQWTIAPGDLLLDVLRREGYFGVKRGCESGECGACTVLVNGKPINSCLMFAAQAEGCEVLTIEGVEQGGKLDPLQEAFLEYGAVQCGFCTPGMILSAKALLAERPDPTEAEVREALAGNFCRCTGYLKPVEAVLAAARVYRAQAAKAGKAKASQKSKRKSQKAKVTNPSARLSNAIGWNYKSPSYGFDFCVLTFDLFFSPLRTVSLGAMMR